MNEYDLRGKVVMITGGTGFIGMAIARLALKSGANVICGSSSTDKVALTDLQLQRMYGPDRFLVCKIDVSSDESVRVAVVWALQKFGKIDALVNCAGRNLKKTFLETTLDDFRTIVDVNLYGAVRTSQAVCRQMIAQGTGGVVINICSVASFQALSGVTTYAVSKAGLLALTRQMSVEAQLLKKGIRTIAIAPGFIPTEQNRAILASGDRGQRILMGIPLERYGEPQEVAEVAVFCLTDASSYMNGCCISVDGGFMTQGVSEAMQGTLAISGKLNPADDVTQLDGCAGITPANSVHDSPISRDEGSREESPV